MNFDKILKLTISFPVQLSTYFVGVNSLLPFAWFFRLPRKSLSSPLELLCLYFIVFWSLISLTVNSIISGLNSGQALATLFNIVNVIVFANVARYYFDQGYRKPKEQGEFFWIVFLFAIYCGLYLYVFTAGAPYNLSSPSLIGAFVNLERTDFLGGIDDASIFRHDWLWMALPRLVVFANYPAATALIITLFLATAMVALRRTSRILVVEIVFCLLVVSFLTRSVLLAYFAGFAPILIYLARNRLKYFLLSTAGIILFALLIFLVLPQQVNVDDARQGSTNIRLEIYRAALSADGFLDTFFGNGAKDRFQQKGIKVGSHSTPIGLFYKHGAPVLAAYVILCSSLTFKALRLAASRRTTYADLVYGRAAIMFVIWSMFEDFDAVPLVCALAGAMVGITNALLRDLRFRESLGYWEHSKIDA